MRVFRRRETSDRAGSLEARDHHFLFNSAAWYFDLPVISMETAPGRGWKGNEQGRCGCHALLRDQSP
jgi:hypothetical protein